VGGGSTPSLSHVVSLGAFVVPHGSPLACPLHWQEPFLTVFFSMTFSSISLCHRFFFAVGLHFLIQTVVCGIRPRRDVVFLRASRPGDRHVHSGFHPRVAFLLLPSNQAPCFVACFQIVTTFFQLAALSCQLSTFPLQVFLSHYAMCLKTGGVKRFCSLCVSYF